MGTPYGSPARTLPHLGFDRAAATTAPTRRAGAPPRIRSSAASASARQVCVALHVQPQPRPPVVRTHRLEPDGQQEVGRDARSARAASGRGRASPNASTARTPRRARSRDHALHQHPAEPAARANSGRTRSAASSTASPLTGAVGNADAARHVRRRRVERVAGRQVVDVDERPARAPAEQRLGDPRLLLEGRVARRLGARLRHRVELPEHARRGTDRGRSSSRSRVRLARRRDIGVRRHHPSRNLVAAADPRGRRRGAARHAARETATCCPLGRPRTAS